MSKTLNLVDHLLTTGRKYQELGRTQDALDLLGRLAGFRELPADVAEEAQARLAELQLRRRKFLRARRHLTAALRYNPDSARYHYLLAGAVHRDRRAEPERAAEHYRQSLELDPKQPQCLAEYGQLLLDQGRTEDALKCLRTAADLAGDDTATLGKLADALAAADQADEARSLLRAALFRNPRDRRFRALWDRFQFRQLHRQQQRARLARLAKIADGPVLLPFVRPAPGTTPTGSGRRLLRRDAAGSLPAPYLGRPNRLSDQRNAQ